MVKLEVFRGRTVSYNNRKVQIVQQVFCQQDSLCDEDDLSQTGKRGQRILFPYGEPWGGALEIHWSDGRLLKHEAEHGLRFNRPKDLMIVSIVDSDFATNKDTRKSTTGYLVTVGSCLVSWMSKALPSVCLLYTSPSPRDRTRSRMPSSA